ncbi:hypothetical protein WEI85_24395 [Actinomycetes bacterium KLBMP 9797]
MVAQLAGDSALDIMVVDLDPRKLHTDRRLEAVDGSLADLGPGEVALARYVAELAGARVGDSVRLMIAGRPVVLRVVATLKADALDTSAMVDPADLDRLGVPAAPTGLLANAARAGDDARTSARTALRAATAGSDGVAIEVLADRRDEMDAQITAMLGIAIGLMVLTVLIAVVGVGSTTALSVVERIREAGLLRGVLPARRAAKVSPMAAIAQDA